MAAADRAFQLQFATDGNINVFTDRTGRHRLHTGRLHPGGHLHRRLDPVPHRLHLLRHRRPDLHALQARRLNRRLDAAQGRGATTFAIPFRGANTITATHGTLWRGLGSAQPVARRADLHRHRPRSPTPRRRPCPSGLAAVGGTRQVTLSWTANTEPDLSGYDLYRDGVKVNTAPITATSYTDTGRSDATTYSYRLAARDTNGNVCIIRLSSFLAIRTIASCFFIRFESFPNNIVIAGSFLTATQADSISIFLRCTF